MSLIGVRVERWRSEKLAATQPPPSLRARWIGERPDDPALSRRVLDLSAADPAASLPRVFRELAAARLPAQSAERVRQAERPANALDHPAAGAWMGRRLPVARR